MTPPPGRPEPLFDATLRYTTELPEEAVVPPEGRQGVYIGSGEGTLTGERIRGTLRWSFYAADCAWLLARQGGPVPPGRHLCTTNPGGFIQTDDGASIRFDANGYGLRGYDQASPHLWRLTMALRFGTDDPRYAWLNTVLAAWEGRFNEQTRSASYHAYLLPP